MEGLKELFTGESIANAVLILSLVSALGFFIGSIRFYSVTLGIAGVLFSGLLFGHLGFKINSHVMEFAREFGLILFVYTIGMQVGPGFVASLRKQGLPLNLMALTIVLLGALVTLGICFLGGIDMQIAVGLFSGATTNTPALGAAQQALKNLANYTEEMGKMPGLGYAVAYPFGILGILIAMGAVRMLFRVSPAKEAVDFAHQQQANAPKVTTLSVTVTNPNLNGVQLKEIPGLTEAGIVISRVCKGKEVRVAKPETVLSTGDVLLAVMPQDKLPTLKMIIGEPASVDLKSVPSHLTTQRILVTRKDILGKSIEELDMDGTHGVTVTRINRGEIELTATPGFELKFGDSVIVVGDAEGIQRASALLGNSTKTLNHPQVVPIFVGIALGIILGSWPMHFPTMPAPVKLGLAGGPLLAAIFLSRLGRLGPIVWYMPQSANFILRELGITLFLSCVGLRAGDRFVATLVNGPGLVWMGYAALITLIPLLIVGLIARAVYKHNYMTICGVLAGSMTDPPALAFANTIAASDAPSIAYATVYPLTMLLRVLTAQLLVLLFMK